ncbi:MAG: hypothetical protein KGM91_13115 [Burkholderiales bacterium]|nr:hypothetical protein [Burkholderiales bacterium]
MTPLGRWRGASLLACCLAWAAPVAAQSRAGEAGAIYTCVDDRGRRLTADRPIPACTAKEQRVLNADGSLRTILPPTLTLDERAEKDARERRAAEERARQADAVRRDRNLMLRYPDEASHQRARAAALQTPRRAMQASQKRLVELAAERKPLVEETEFYTGKPLPLKLQQALDANDAATEAQRSAVASQQVEIDRINHNYDLELERLRRLWAGAAPGSLGAAMVAAPAASTPR